MAKRSKYSLARRTFLRGVAGGASVSVGLPLLETMLNANGTVLADGEARPTRFGLWYMGNGVFPAEWGGEGLGEGWTPKRALKALGVSAGEPLRPYVSVLRGLTIPSYATQYKGDSSHNYHHAHHSGAATMLSGDQHLKIANVRDTIASQFRHRTVDMEAAAHFDGQTAFRSIEVGIVGTGGTDEGPAFQYVSHNGIGSVNVPIDDPAKVFERVFGGRSFSAAHNEARTSILDAIREQNKDLQKRLSTSDKVRMEAHLESIRALEQRIEIGIAACSRPDAPASMADGVVNDAIGEKNKIMSGLIAKILSCDLTRVFSVTFSRCGSPFRHAGLGMTSAHHSTSHNDPAWEALIGNATVYTMEQLKFFLETLRTTEDGDGNLLDHVSILTASEHGNGHNHSYAEEFPIMILGKGSGRLRTGQQWLNFKGSQQMVTHAALTALHGAGVTLPSWGHGVAKANAPLTELLK